MCLFLPWMLIYFLYPQLRIARVVTNAKKAVMVELQEKIDQLYYATDLHEPAVLDQMTKYGELLDRLEKQRTHVWDAASAYRFGSAVLVPTLVFLMQNPDATEHAIQLVRGWFLP